MEPNEDSIKMLEMRMRRQMNNLPEKNIKMENIQYYVSSAMLQKEVPQDLQQQEVSGDAEKMIFETLYEKLQHGQELTEEEKGILQQASLETYGTAGTIDAGASAAHNITGEFMEGEEYGRMPVDAEYIERVDGIRRQMEAIVLSGTKEVQLARAKSGYERVRQALETGESLETKNPFHFDAKG